MSENAAEYAVTIEAEGDLNDDLNDHYNEELYERFVTWKNQSGATLQKIARKMQRSTAAISQYLGKKYQGNISNLEHHIEVFLSREEDLQVIGGADEFCQTSISTLIWEVLQYCDFKRKMGVALAPSGSGKTETCKEYKRKNPATIFITADVTTRAPSQILRLITAHVGFNKSGSISQMLHETVDRLKGSNRMIIIDDGHFLSWESFEMVRKVYDCAGVGVVYVGQERLYEQMKGTDQRAYLYDQIFSRIAIKRDKFRVVKADAEMIVNGICPELGPECVDYLYSKARGKGRYRAMTNLLDVAMMMNEQYGTEIDLKCLQDADRFLVG